MTTDPIPRRQVEVGPVWSAPGAKGKAGQPYGTSPSLSLPLPQPSKWALHTLFPDMPSPRSQCWATALSSSSKMALDEPKLSETVELRNEMLGYRVAEAPG